MTISRSTEVAAPVDLVWALVSDLPAMGRLSPENIGGSWRGGATGPAVGARFTGRNRNGWRRWKTSVEVTTCEPGSAFSFEVSYLRVPVATWSYALAPGPDGCTVTESWQDRRPSWFKAAGGFATGVPDRGDGTVGVELERTLATLKAVAERAHA